MDENKDNKLLKVVHELREHGIGATGWGTDGFNHTVKVEPQEIGRFLVVEDGVDANKITVHIMKKTYDPSKGFTTDQVGKKCSLNTLFCFGYDLLDFMTD